MTPEMEPSQPESEKQSVTSKKEMSESKIDRVVPISIGEEISADKVIEELKDKYNSIKKVELNGVSRSNHELTTEEVQRKVSEVGDFSTVLEDILLFMLQKIEIKSVDPAAKRTLPTSSIKILIGTSISC